MSPEVTNNNDYECEVDIWILGLIAYELLSGDAPFRGNIKNKNELF